MHLAHEHFTQALCSDPDETEGSASSHVGELLEAIRSHLDMDVAFISRQVGDTHRVFTHVAAKGHAPIAPGVENANDNSVCWQVIKGNIPERITDTSTCSIAKALPVTEELKVRAHFSIPLKRENGEVHGSLCCFSHRPRPEINDRDMNVLRAFAGVANSFISNSIEKEEERKQAANAITRIIADNRLSIWHQPIIDLTSGRKIGRECLARVDSPKSQGPDHWFARADIGGLSVELELHAVKKALVGLDQCDPDSYLAINVSPVTLASRKLAELLPNNCRRQLVLEITEHKKITDYEAVKRAIGRLRPKAQVAIDDVGAGFANLRHLVDLEPDMLKLDQKLTQGISNDPARRALASALVMFADEIGAKLVAEGIETEAELRSLMDCGARIGQGYLFGKPQPPIGNLVHCAER